MQVDKVIFLSVEASQNGWTWGQAEGPHADLGWYVQSTDGKITYKCEDMISAMNRFLNLA